MSNTIQEQGPKNYTAMQARLEAARKADGAPREQVAAGERSAAEVQKLVANLTGDATPLFVPSEAAKGCFHVGKTCKEALCWGEGSPVAVPVVADVENDGNRGPKVPRVPTPRELEDADRALLLSRMGTVAAGLSWPHVRVLSWMLSQFPPAALIRACEEATAKGIRAAGDDRGMDPTSTRETAIGALLGAWDAAERLMLPVSEHRPRRTIGDYKSGLVPVPAKDGAR